MTATEAAFHRYSLAYFFSKNLLKIQRKTPWRNTFIVKLQALDLQFHCKRTPLNVISVTFAKYFRIAFFTKYILSSTAAY